MAIPQLKIKHLREILQSRFNPRERKTLCFDLEKSDEIEDVTSPIEIVGYYKRQGQLPILNKKIYEMRPTIVISYLLSHPSMYSITAMDIDALCQKFSLSPPNQNTLEYFIKHLALYPKKGSAIAKWLEEERPGLFTSSSDNASHIQSDDVREEKAKSVPLIEEDASEDQEDDTLKTERAILQIEPPPTFSQFLSQNMKPILMAAGVFCIVGIIVFPIVYDHLTNAFNSISPNPSATPTTIVAAIPSSSETPTPTPTSTQTQTPTQSPIATETQTPQLPTATDVFVDEASASSVLSSQEPPSPLYSKVSIFVNDELVSYAYTTSEGIFDHDNHIKIPDSEYEIQVEAPGYEIYRRMLAANQAPESSIVLLPVTIASSSNVVYPTLTPTAESSRVITLISPGNGEPVPISNNITLSWSGENIQGYQLLMRQGAIDNDEGRICKEINIGGITAETSPVHIEPICAGEWLWKVVSADGQVSSEWRRFWYARTLPSPTPTPTITPPLQTPTYTPTPLPICQIVSAPTGSKKAPVTFELHIEPKTTNETFEVILNYDGEQDNCPSIVSSGPLHTDRSGNLSWSSTEADLPSGCITGWSWHVASSNGSVVDACHGGFYLEYGPPEPKDPSQNNN